MIGQLITLNQTGYNIKIQSVQVLVVENRLCFTHFYPPPIDEDVLGFKGLFAGIG